MMMMMMAPLHPMTADDLQEAEGGALQGCRLKGHWRWRQPSSQREFAKNSISFAFQCDHLHGGDWERFQESPPLHLNLPASAIDGPDWLLPVTSPPEEQSCAEGISFFFVAMTYASKDAQDCVPLTAVTHLLS